MEIHPCVPDNWEQFDVDFKWKDAEYFIKYRRTGKYDVQVFENGLEHENQDITDYKIELKNRGKYIINVMF